MSDAYPPSLNTAQVSSTGSGTFIATEVGSRDETLFQRETDPNTLSGALDPPPNQASAFHHPIVEPGPSALYDAENSSFTSATDKLWERANEMSHSWMMKDHETEVSKNCRKRMMKEIKNAAEWTSPTLGAHPVADRFNDALGWFEGPRDTPYAGGVFYVRFYMTSEYPFRPPVCKFLTRIYHPNIDFRGRICLDVIEHGWSPVLTLRTILLSISSLLGEPSVDEPLVPEIAETFLNDNVRFREIASKYTEKYALRETPDLPDTGPDGAPWYRDLQVEPTDRAIRRIHAGLMESRKQSEEQEKRREEKEQEKRREEKKQEKRREEKEQEEKRSIKGRLRGLFIR